MANDNGAVKYAVTIDDSKMKNDASQIVNQFQQIGAEAKKQGDAIDSAFTSAASNIGKAFAAIGIASTLTELGKQVLTIRGEFEKLDVAFEVILGSGEKAKSLMKDLVQTAATTPFDLQGVANGAKMLLAYGTEAKNVNDTLVRLGNIASGLSIPLNDLVMLYGTTQTQGRLFTQDLRQFMGRGIPLAAELAKQFGVTDDKVGELVTQGKVGFPQVQRAIESLTNEGGKFYGLMEKQSKTVAGQISNIGDALDSMFNKIGEDNSKVIGAGLQSVKYMIEHYEQFGTVLATVAAAYGEYKASLMLIAAYNNMLATQEASIEAERQMSLTTLLEETAAQNAQNASEVANAATKTASASAIDAKIVAMQQELAAQIQIAEQNYINATNEAARMALALEAAQAHTAACYEELQAVTALGNGEAIEAAENKFNTAVVEENAAARALQAQRANVQTAATAKEAAAQRLSTFNTKLDTIEKKKNAATTGLLTGVTMGLKKALDALKLAWATNPLGIALIAITTLIGAITLFSSKTEEATDTTSRFNEAINADMTRLNNLKAVLNNTQKGLKTYNDAVSGLISLGKEYNITIETENGEIKDMKHSYDQLTQAIRKNASEKLLAESATKANEDAMKAEKDAMDELMKQAQKAVYSTTETFEDENGEMEVSVVHLCDHIRSITSATWNMISQDVMMYSKEIADEFAKGQEQGEKAVADEVATIENMLRELGATDEEINAFHDDLTEYVTASAQGFVTAYTELNRTQAQINGLTGSTSLLGSTSKDATDLAKLGYDELKNKQSEVEQQINMINASKLDPEVKTEKVQELRDLLVEINGLLPEKVTVGTDAELSKRLQDLKTQRDSVAYGSEEWKKLNDQIKEVDKTLRSHKKNYAETKNSASASDSKGKTKQQLKNEAEQLRKQTESFQREQESIALQREREAKDLEFSIEQAKIDALEEGEEKYRRQIKLDADKNMEELRRGYEDLQREKIERERKLFEADPKNKGKSFKYDKNDPRFAYTDDEKENYQRQKNNVSKTYNEEIEKLNQKQIDAMNEFLKQYGDIESRRLAITESYQQKIDNAQTSGEKMSLAAQMQKDLDALENELKNGVNWEVIFTNIDNYSVDFLQKIKKQIQTELNDINIDPKDAEALTSKLEQVNAQIHSKKNAWKQMFGLAIPELEKIRQLEDEVKSAQENLERAQKTLNDQLLQEMEIRQKIVELMKSEGVNVGTDDVNIGNAQNLLALLSGKSENAQNQLASLLAQLGGKGQQVAAAQKGVTTATTSLQGAQAAKGGASGGASGFAITDAIIHAVNDNLQSLSDMIADFGLENTKGGKAMTKFAESSQYATQAFDSLKKGDFIGVAGNLNKAFGSLGETLGVLGIGGMGSSDQNLHQDIERLTAVNEALKNAIENLTDEMSNSAVADAAGIYDKQKEYLETSAKNTSEMMVRSLNAYSNGFLGIGGHHSSRSKVNEGMSSADWQRLSSLVDSTINNATDFFNLSSQEMATIANYAPDLYAKIKDLADDGHEDAAKYMDEYIEYGKQLQELQDAFNEKLTNTSFDSVKDKFKSTIMDMTKTSRDFANDFESMMKEAVFESMMSDAYAKRLKAWYESFSAKMEDGKMTKSEQEDLKNQYQQIVQDAMKERDELYETLGWDKLSSQKASSGTHQTMSEDTGEELSGRFTALQASAVMIYEQMKAQYDQIVTMSAMSGETFSVMSEMNNLVYTCSELLTRIASNTDVLPSMENKLEKIRIHVERL